MKLSGLNSTICERTGPYEHLRDREEKLGYLHMMLATQGLDPTPIVQRVKGLIDPEFAKKEGQKMSLKNWLQRAKRGEIRKGTSHGRKIEIVVTESIMSKLREIISGRKESGVLNKALEENPSFTYILRLARQSDQPVQNDPAFWRVVERITGNAREIKKLVNAYHDIEDDMDEQPIGESVINEARVSDVLSSLGLDKNFVDGIIRQYNIKDEDYALSKLKQTFGKAAGKMGEKVRELPGKAKEFMRQLPGKVAEFGKTMVSRDVRDSNEDYAEDVIRIAYVLAQKAKALGEQGVISPGELTRDAG